MADNTKNGKKIRCPECFVKESDMDLMYDERDDEYYCIKCCYVGKEEDIERYYNFYRANKFKDMRKSHPAQK